MTSRHHVHIYATVRVKVAVDARGHQEAMARADHLLFDNGFAVRLMPNADAVLDAEYAEEVSGYLVDEADDPECTRSKTYDADHQPIQSGDVDHVSAAGPVADGSDGPRRVVVEIEDGLVSAVIADGPVAPITVDHDTECADEADLSDIPPRDGKEAKACIDTWMGTSVTRDPGWIDAVFTKLISPEET